MTIYEKLSQIQRELKAPKNQRNNFGNYNYRSCEDILEGVKPHLEEFYLTINDEIVQVGERYYIKATATLSNGSESICNSAFAREPENKKGMDESQVTGASSSYARKYALNGLFAIDDTKDADSMDNTEKQVKKPIAKPINNKTISDAQLKKLNVLLNEKGKKKEDVYKVYKVASLTELSLSQASDAIKRLNELESVVIH